MRVLITRPEPDASALAELLRARGHAPIVAPLMTIAVLPHKPPEGIEDAVLLFTSANGPRAARAHHVRAARRCFAVGEATAKSAREAGFEVEAVAEGNVESLAALAADRLPKEQLLVHVAGSDLAGDLVGALGAQGFRAIGWTAYAARAAETLPSPATAFLRGQPGTVLLYSPRSARLLVELMEKDGLGEAARHHRGLCLSQAVADSAHAISWASLAVAAKPSQEALLNLLS